MKKTVDRRFIVHAALAPLLLVVVACGQEPGPDSPTDSTTGATSAAETGAPADAIVMKPHTVNDPGSGSMPSHTVLVPADWTVEGAAWWAGPNLFSILPSQNIKIAAPDGRLVHLGPNIGAVDFQPSEYAQFQLGTQRPPEGGIDNGYPVLHMPDTLDDWRVWMRDKILPQERPGATDIDVAPVVMLPELTALLLRQLAPIQQQNEQQNQQSQAMGGGTFSFTDGAVLGFTCTYQQDGRAWEEMIILGVTYFGLDSQVGRQLWWSIEPNVAYRAPAGELDANLPLFYAIANSLRMTPQWANMKANHAAKMNQIKAKGTADRSRILADSHRDIMKIITDGYNERQAIQDKTHEKFINTIREVENYTTPDGESTVQLPSYYEHVYTNGNGEYILTNDALYNPNTDSTVNSSNWDAMRVTE